MGTFLRTVRAQSYSILALVIGAIKYIYDTQSVRITNPTPVGTTLSAWCVPPGALGGRGKGEEKLGWENSTVPYPILHVKLQIPTWKICSSNIASTDLKSPIVELGAFPWGRGWKFPFNEEPLVTPLEPPDEVVGILVPLHWPKPPGIGLGCKATILSTLTWK